MEYLAWEIVKKARKAERPKGRDYVAVLFDDFVEIHGDRCFGDDKAITVGLGMFHGEPVTVMAQSKGKNIEENIERNFGMSNPEGYRKILRAAKQAEKFNRPIITFVDTAGAFPGRGAEERGQAEAIAQCLYQFSDLKTPIICVVVGEGGSGGALALTVGDRIIMLENAIYSVLSPEGMASILWKDETLASKASQLMKLTAKDLKEAGIVDEIIDESQGKVSEGDAIKESGRCRDESFFTVIRRLDEAIYKALREAKAVKIKELVNKRYEKYRKIGVY